MSVVYENPKLNRDAVSCAWSVRDDNGMPRAFRDEDWDVKVIFTRKPLKVGDSVRTMHGKITGKIVAIHADSKVAWVSGVNVAPSTFRLQDLRHADDV